MQQESDKLEEGIHQIEGRHLLRKGLGFVNDLKPHIAGFAEIMKPSYDILVDVTRQKD